MKRPLLYSMTFAIVFLLVACGGGSGESGNSSVGTKTIRETWSGSDSDGLIAFRIYTDGTFDARGTVNGGYTRSGNGTYSQIGSAITGTFIGSNCTFSATITGNTMTGISANTCQHPGVFFASLANIQPYTWQADGNGFEQFIMSDPQYYEYYFTYTFSPTTPMSTVTATIKRQSGSADYGIIFCRQDSNNFYMLSTTIGGHYAVYARVGGSFSTIISWTSSPNLNTGYGIENDVSVVQTSPHNFSIYFNGTFIRSFTDGNFTGGTNGFYASVADQSYEFFPGLPVDVRFRLTSPVIFP